MPYFPVDDKAHSHRKFIRAGAHAIGLWTFCGSWSNDHGTDGFVPDYIAKRFDPKWKTLATRLVEAGLWEIAEVKDERGWRFHEWAGSPTSRRNFTRAEVEEKRRQGAERQQRSREKRGIGTPDVTRDNGVTNGVTHASALRQSRGGRSDPSHPIPKPLKPVVEQAVELPTDEDHSDAAETQPAPRSTAPWVYLPKHRCEIHCQPDDKRCPACKDEFGDPAHYAKLRASK